MTCAAVIALAGSVYIEPREHGLATQSDVVAAAPVAEGYQVCYYNHPAQVSVATVFELDMGDGVVLVLRVSFDKTDAEVLEIRPPEGFVVYPADFERIPLADGESVTALIMTPIY